MSSDSFHFGSQRDDVHNSLPTINTQESATQEQASRNLEKQRLNASNIFKVHFRKQKFDGEMKACCNYCNKRFFWKSGSGYGSYKYHLVNAHPEKIGVETNQTHNATSSNLSSFHYSEKKNREELAKCVAVDHLSFSFGEKLGFNNYCVNALNPQAKRVPRTTLTRTLKSLYRKTKKDLEILFSNFDSKVSVCCDIWSDHWQIHHYMGITCHWVDNDWIIQKRIIAFRVFDERHTADNIFKLIKIILEEYNLTNKIFSISFDNASANTASVFDLINNCSPILGGKYFHVRCICHVLNLCVQDGLLVSQNNLVLPIKKALNYLWGHPKLMKQWFEFCKMHNVSPKRFSRDVPTRWNSTYDMIVDSIGHKDLLCSFIQQNCSTLTLWPTHWDECSALLKLLKCFNDATYLLSGVYYPTSHLLLYECVNIADVMHEHENNIVLSSCIKSMRDKWVKYYEEIPPLNLVASIFDPRTKLDGLFDYLTTYYNLLHLSDSVSVSSIISNSKKDIENLYDEYYRVYKHMTSDVAESSLQNDTSSTSKLSLAERMRRQKRQRPSQGNNSELEKYLSTNFEFSDEDAGNDFQVIQWWKCHQSLFPILAMIAKDVFSSPVSTTSVERAFSMGGQILDETRSRMSPDSLEAQACLDDWTRAKYRQQEYVRDNEEELENIDSDVSSIRSEDSD